MLSVSELVLCTCSCFISVFSFTRKCCKANGGQIADIHSLLSAQKPQCLASLFSGQLYSLTRHRTPQLSFCEHVLNVYLQKDIVGYVR